MTNPNNLKARAFLAAFKTCASITRAAQAAGISRDLHYRWIKESKSYAAAFEEARVQAGQSLEDEAVRRAKEGTFKPNVYQGGFCYGESEYELDEAASSGNRKVYKLKNGARPMGIVEYSDTLLIALLKANLPDKYRERGSVEHTGGIAITITQADADL